jgi:hypothetical protein
MDRFGPCRSRSHRRGVDVRHLGFALFTGFFTLNPAGNNLVSIKLQPDRRIFMAWRMLPNFFESPSICFGEDFSCFDFQSCLLPRWR